MQRIATRLLGRATRLRALKSRNEDGMTLVEVIVSISLLGIFAITFAPILYTNLDISTRQTTIAFASQQAATYIDEARVNGGQTCQSLSDYLDYAAHPSSIKNTTDERDVPVKVSGVITGGCTPAPSGPTTATLTVTACEPAAGASPSAACAPGDRDLAVVSTQIMVLS